MKTIASFLQPGPRLLALLLGLWSCQTVRAVVGFSVTPAAVSNTYSGMLTLQVTGLSNGETVVIQKFLDANTNGVIDGADLLWQQFELTDGQASVISGVTNINVPGDTDATPGQITARVLFRTSEPILNVIGKYGFKLSSPTGLFTPLTNAFTITGTAYAQSLTGNIVNHGTNVPNAVVILFLREPDDDGPGSTFAGTVANNSGGYAIQVPAGTYSAVAFKSNYLGYLLPSPVVVASGVNLSTNLALTNATRTISGRLVDGANHATGLPGLFAHADGGGLVAVVTSDTNGNFTFPVGPGNWQVGAIGVDALGYINVDSDSVAPIDTTTGNVSGLVIPHQKANALFFGTVRDDQGQPLAGIEVDVENDDYSHWSGAFTDENGNYVVGALGGEPWEVEVDDDQPGVANYLFTQNFSTNISAGQVIQLNFTGLRATNHITGRLLNNLGQAITNISIHAYATIGGTYYSIDQETDTSGYYSLNVANGIWTVYVCEGDYDTCLNSDYFGPLSQTIGITNNNGVADFIATIAPRHITGSVKDGSNNAVPNAYVYASAMINGTYYFRWGWTDASGNYSLGVTNGSWGVGLNCGVLSDLGYGCVNAQSVMINNGDGLANFVVQSCDLQITNTSPLPDGEVDMPYEFHFEASGCDNNFTWSVSGPVALPSGLYLEPDGWLDGWPDTPGTYSFSVRVQDNSGHAVEKTFSLEIHPASTGSATDYYVARLKTYRQTNSVNVVADSNQGPYNSYLGIIQSSLDLITNATCALPSGIVNVFPPGISAVELQVHEAFTSESGLLLEYPPGDYGFQIKTRNEGNYSATLHLPATPFPDAPHVSNQIAAQGINPASPFELRWDPLSVGTNDYIRLAIFATNTAPAFRLWWYPESVFEEWFAPEETSGEIPAGQLEANHTYLGLLQFIRYVDFNDVDYPDAYGNALVCAQTAFSLATTTSAPKLAEPFRLSSTEFRFLLSGVPGEYYAIQKSTNPNSMNWSTLIVTNAPAVIVDVSATNRNAFYRAASAPPP